MSRESTTTEPQSLTASRKDFAWLIGMSTVQLVVLLPFSAYIASLPFIQDEWGMTNTQSGIVFSAFLVGYALSSLVLVPLTDRISPSRVMIAGVIAIALSNLLFPLLAQDFWSGSFLRLLMGAGHVATYIPGIKLVSSRFAGGRRGMAVGMFVSAGYAGTTVSYVFMGALLSNTPSWRDAYMITALVGLIGVLLSFLLVRDRTGRVSTAQDDSARGKGLLSLEMLRDRAVVLAILAYALHTAELYMARLWLPLLLGATFIQSGREPLEAAALAATLSGLMFMMGIFGVFLGGIFSDYLGRTAGASLIFALSGASSFVIGWLVGVPPGS